ncbi:MAG: 5'/3'-nucleotidase SurE [Candidatus Aminicenantes bacterium]|nr:5'/3'-nucleotidase SurE [Candidatus Aminicenantes bacterium]MDH5705256.1 5'/3'-nucleotidase SurE [Candidatus Aminicenantes bacterium]
MKKRVTAILALLILLGISLQSEKKELLILVTNDDGIESPSLCALAKEMTKLGTVIVVAPKINQSGTSHVIRYDRPTFFGEKELVPGVKSYWVDNTPVACVRWAIAGPLEGAVPDLVISGINRGLNLGPGYESGTVGAAREGALAGAIAIAASQLVSGEGADYEGAAVVVRELAQKALSLGDKPLLWNVNIPGGKIIDSSRKIVVTKMIRRWWKMKYVVNKDIDGKPYFWIDREPNVRKVEPESDFAYIIRGYITVTPHIIYQTDFAGLEKAKALFRE